jgi:YHS domain-containing protein
MHAVPREVDLVCGKPVERGPETPSVAFGPQRFFFCSAACRDRFVALPVLYLRRAWSRKRPDRLEAEQFLPEGGHARC